MRLFPFFAVLLFVYSNNFGQGENGEKDILSLDSYAQRLEVIKTGQLIITTKAGEVAIAVAMNKNWVKMNPSNNDDGINFGITFDQSNFFNNDTGFVSGHIDNDNKNDIIYHTKNGGKTWEKINFGLDGWVDATSSLYNGEAWMSVSGKQIAYTTDFGLKWQLLQTPNKTHRYTSIFFNEKREGLMGSLGNLLYYTNNNCNSWQPLPTPLDQSKYRKTDLSRRTEINKVAIFKEFLLICQEGLVFYTKKDKIDWVWLPKYANFYTDAYNSGLYFRTNKRTFVSVDSSLAIKGSFDKPFTYNDATCSNETLFVKTDREILKWDNAHPVSITKMYTGNRVAASTGKAKAEYIGTYAGYAIGSVKNKIYTQKGYDEPWEYKLTLPFNTDSGSLQTGNKNNIIFIGRNDTVSYYDIPKGIIKTKRYSSLLTGFTKSPVQKITFENGSAGCFHHYSNYITYAAGADEFVLEEEHRSGSENLSGYNDYIGTNSIENFIAKLPSTVDQLSKIEHLGFTEKDYEKCKKDIYEFQNTLGFDKRNSILEKGFRFAKNNLDFPLLISMVDSIKTINDTALNFSLRYLSDNFSTTSNWLKIRLINENEEVLEISNIFYEPNSFHIPWRISLDGIVLSSSTSMEINNFIESVFPAFLENTDKVKVLHKLVKDLYEAHVENTE